MNPIIEKLSLYNSEERRNETIQELLGNYKQYDLKMFVLPGGRKDCWPCCAKFLVSLPEDAFVSILPDALEWLQDRTWPGAPEIERRALSLPAGILKPICMSVYQRAMEEKDTEWVYSLESVFGRDIFV